MKIIRTILLTLLSLPLCMHFAFADDEVTVVLEPEHPAPKSNVTLTVQSYYFDVNIAKIKWKVNGATVAEGQGKKSITVRTGAIGQFINVVTYIELQDGSSYEIASPIAPSSVLLLYEAPKSYVPSFYEGRSLPSEGAYVRVTALPQITEGGVMLPASSLSYAWYVDDSVVDSASGFGKQTATLRLNYLRNETEIKVLVRSPGGSVAEKTITIVPHAVMPLLYTYNQILGTNFSSLIGKRFETTENFTVALEPFYISKEGKNGGSPLYTWLLDGLPSTPLDGRLLSFQPKENSYGSKTLNITLKGPDNYLQEGETETEFIFDTRK